MTQGQKSWTESQLAVLGQRATLARALSMCLAVDILELTNPAAGAVDDLKAATATTVAAQTWLKAALKSAGITKLTAAGAVGGRKITFTTAGGTAAHAPANCVITGFGSDGAARSETLALSQIADTVTSVCCYTDITSVVFATGDGTDATIAMGIADSFGLPSKLKQRASGASVLAELVDGSAVGTGGAAATAVNQTVVATNQTVVATNQNTTATNNNTTAKCAGAISLTNPIAAELITVVADALLADGAQAIAAQPDVPRKLQVRITDGDSSISAGTVSLVGVSAGGKALTQEIALAGGTRTVVTTDAYASLTSATVAGLVGHGAGDNMGIGVGNGFGLPVPEGATNLVVTKTFVDGAGEAVAGVDAAAYSVAPTTAADAVHDYQFFFAYDWPHTHVQAAHNHTQDTHNHTQDTHNHTQNSHSHTGAEGEATITAAATALPNGAYAPVTTPNGAHDYALVFEQDMS
jgi:hypothetical protein